MKIIIMKIILSRKGFDSSFGGYPSPILPDGSLISLPIPQDNSGIRYKDIQINKNETYLDLMNALGMKYDNSSQCHLDPDLRFDAYNRKKNWKPLFGQMSAAQSHLQGMGVKEGDVFLFFGWFQNTKRRKGKLQFDKKETGKHLIYGYMQIESIKQLHHFEVVEDWMKYHPHASFDHKGDKFNTLYIARNLLSWNDSIQGAGVFRYKKDLVLTKEGYTRTIWDPPDFFKDVDISYHDTMSWKHGSFKSASRGQEFVINENKQVEQWAKKLISHSI